jgi:hypothetical protein
MDFEEKRKCLNVLQRSERTAEPGVPYYYYKRYHIIIMRVIGIRD